MTSKHAWKVDLIPWDHKSADHVARMHEQRIACGWGAERVPSYVEWASNGTNIFYWVVLADELPEREKLLAKHIAKYPKEATPLIDTAKEDRLATRVPNEKHFMPIGHIGLDTQLPDEVETRKLDLPHSGVIWLRALYVSYALQRGGFGVATMSKVEQLATLEPLNASTMALDTAAHESMMHEVLQKIAYDDRGLQRPTQSNQEWYTRMGYKLFARSNKVYEHEHPDGTFTLKSVFLRKTLR